MIVFKINNEHDDEIKADNALVVTTKEKDDSAQSFLVGNLSDVEVLNMVEFALATGLRQILKCDCVDLKIKDFSNKEALLSRIEAYERAFNTLKKETFFDVFEDVISKTIEQTPDKLDLLQSLAKSSANKYLKFESTKIDLNAIKEHAAKALGVDSPDKIHIDIEEYIKQAILNREDDIQ